MKQDLRNIRRGRLIAALRSVKPTDGYDSCGGGEVNLSAYDIATHIERAFELLADELERVKSPAGPPPDSEHR